VGEFEGGSPPSRSDQPTGNHGLIFGGEPVDEYAERVFNISLVLGVEEMCMYGLQLRAEHQD
jgi:hypothetical protein